MTRVAIVGGGIAGLAAAYELERHRRGGKSIDWQLFEASDRLGGTVSTTRVRTRKGDYVLEDGPDGWVTEKPWARELAEELGLADDLIVCDEAERKTYIVQSGRLVPMPSRMRLMVPADLRALDESFLFSTAAKAAYRAEVPRADALKASAPHGDESVASFVRRHFGEDVLRTVGAPLLSGVFGGDVERLSVRAVMPWFVRMEAEHGSLIAATEASWRARGDRPPPPTFTSLRNGMGSLVEALVASLPPERLKRGHPVREIVGGEGGWVISVACRGPIVSSAVPDVGSLTRFDTLMLATPLDATRQLLRAWELIQTPGLPVEASVLSLLPADASSALLITFCWPPAQMRFKLPPGFGFLVPQGSFADAGPELLACTFATQKFPHRAPAGACILRVFLGGAEADRLHGETDSAIAGEAWQGLLRLLPGLPAPEEALTTVRRWPRSLPQYEVGHLERIAELERRVRAVGGLHLLGNSYHGVGVPDLIGKARTAARRVAESLH